MNPFLGWDRTRLEAELEQARSDLAAGKITIRAGSGEILIQSQPEISLVQRIRYILTALNIIDPATYPMDQISQAGATKITFNSASQSY